jgi:phosphohistidine phosphatase SixA
MLDLQHPIIETRVLTPLERPERVWEEIRDHQDAKQVMIVGHEPQLSGVVGYLIGAPDASVDLKKGAIARVDVDLVGPRPTGVLVWLLTAKLAGA